MAITRGGRFIRGKSPSPRTASTGRHAAWSRLLLGEALGQRAGRGQPPRRLAVVLGGGGNLGAYQVGVIAVLARAGVHPDLLVGTSVGALNAAFWACYPGSDVGERLLQLWQTGAVNKILSPNGWWLRLLRRSDHLFASEPLRRLIARWVAAEQRIEETAIPLAVVATDFETGERVVLWEGSLLSALLASSAIPGLFQPVEVAGKLLVDGGLVANADLETAVEAGATEALVVDVMGEPPRERAITALQALDRSLLLASRRQTDLLLAAARGHIKVSLLRPRLPWLPWMGDFSHTRELFDMGRAAAEELLSGAGSHLLDFRSGSHIQILPSPSPETTQASCHAASRRSAAP